MLERLQDDIEAIYRVEVPYRVQDFVVDDATRALLRPSSTAPEELLVVQEPDGLSLGLYLDETVRSRLAGLDPDDPAPILVRDELSAWSTALEGVSHFVYVAHRAASDRSVSLLELEAQAEVDKFVVGWLYLWRRGHKDCGPRLWRRLFHDVSYRGDLDADAERRYRTANALGAAYGRSLLGRYLDHGNPEALFRELREVWRRGGGEKLSALGATLH